MLRQDRLQNSFKVFVESTGTVIKSLRFPMTLRKNEGEKRKMNNELKMDIFFSKAICMILER